MSFKVLYVTSTEAEAEALTKISSLKETTSGFRKGRAEIFLLVAGIGSVQTIYNICRWISVNGKPDLAINAGIAGSFNDEFRCGDVVMPVNDCFADSGIEDRDSFKTLFESGLSDPEEFPFKNGIIHADNFYTEKLRLLIKPVNAITVNTATGSEKAADRLIKKFNPQIETMEGASFFYLCARENIPFFAVRSISNRIEDRNREKWNIPLAINRLSGKIDEIFKILS